MTRENQNTKLSFYHCRGRQLLKCLQRNGLSLPEGFIETSNTVNFMKLN